MSIDPYSLCPGGTGKKVKFCCSDLVQDLDKVTKLLDGEQPTACLEMVRKLDEKYPGRACLQNIRVGLERAVGEESQAQATLESFLAQHANNPVALAQKVRDVGLDDPLEGLNWLQKALEACGEEIPLQVYETMGDLAAALLATGHSFPAHMLIQLQIDLADGKDQDVLKAFLKFEGAPTVPILFKGLRSLAPPPEDVPWKAEFEKALEAASQGHWQRAAKLWTALASKADASPALWQNLATMRGAMGDYSGAAQALRKLAALCSLQEDAIEAEAMAQLLTAEDEHGSVDELSLTLPVSNAEAAQEKMAADRRFERMPLEPAAWTENGEPPPRAAFEVLDRALPTTGVGMQREQVPNSLGQLLLFGKQTDREAQIELSVFQPDLDNVQKTLREVLGDLLGAPQDEKVHRHITQVEHALSWHWRFPDDTPAEVRAALNAEQRRFMVLERWPTIPQPMFGGRNAQQAASEPQYRLKLLAAILLLQLSDSSSPPDAFNELRRRLDLPPQTDFDASGSNIARLPLARLAWLKVETLSDEQLQTAFHRAGLTSFTLALRRLAPAVIERPGLPVDKAKLPAYRLLARFAATTDQALRLVEDARRLAEANGHSSASWDLTELAIRSELGDGRSVVQLIQHVYQQHGREPGVMQSLMQLMVQVGLMTPDGQLVGPPMASGGEPALIMPGAGGETGKLWTPDAPQASGEKKSALWIPD